MPKEETLELRQIFAVIRRWGWLIVGCTLLALILALIVTSRMPPAYEATTTLLVAPVEQTSTSEINTLMAGERLALTYVQMLKGRPNLETTISLLGLEETLRSAGEEDPGRVAPEHPTGARDCARRFTCTGSADRKYGWGGVHRLRKGSAGGSI